MSDDKAEKDSVWASEEEIELFQTKFKVSLVFMGRPISRDFLDKMRRNLS